MTPPDSGVDTRVLLCKRHGNLGCLLCEPDSGEREVTERNADPDTLFSIRRGLAQRILAALECGMPWSERDAVREELRAAVERKP